MSGQENLQAGSLQQQPESAIQSSSSGKVSLSPKTQMEQNTSCVNHVQSGSKYRDFVANNTDLSDADFDSPVKRIDNLAILSSHDKSQPGPGVVYISLFSSSATSGTLSGRSNFMRSLSIWSLYASYFPACLHRSEALLPTRKYIFGYHPHGIISHGAFAAFATEALGFSRLFPGITNTLLTLDSNFRIPFYREYALAMGLASVSRESCENLLSKGGADGEGMGRAITIVIGGARESLHALPHSLRLVLKCRKGFIRLAIRTGADLVPVLAFGENDLYEQVRSDQHPIIHKLQMLIKRTMGFTVPLFHARGVFNYDVGLMPYRRPLNIVVGRPIQVVQQRDRDKIDETYIDDLHAKYIQELRRLWEQYKDVFAKDRISEIEIVA
ncbi:diacylglycerol o-acyltransferase [Aspergillus fumigatus Z5]|nr:diacylglycerol o-acyltransferase [Aspergillus fumigatus Z5]